jgi:hypothetical protein
VVADVLVMDPRLVAAEGLDARLHTPHALGRDQLVPLLPLGLAALLAQSRVRVYDDPHLRVLHEMLR